MWKENQQESSELYFILPCRLGANYTTHYYINIETTPIMTSIMKISDGSLGQGTSNCFLPFGLITTIMNPSLASKDD
jgi:hypothetical protein